MSKSPNAKRDYDSTRRQAQARKTRSQIIEAARKLFVQKGYSGATIASISQEASVSTETVYAVFGNKRNILSKLIEVSVGGDDRPIPLLQREGPQDVLMQKDPVHLLQLFAQDITGILERVAPVFEITRMAAKREPDIAAMLVNLLDQRYQNLRIVTQHLQALGALREGMGETRATESMWVITSPEVYNLLTTDRGWTKEIYMDWLKDSLVRLLLA